MSGLAGKTVVLGVTGGIAAYKAAELCRLLIKAGAKVRVVMTEAATQFVGPLTLQTLSGAPVARGLLDADEEARIGHIRLGDEADLIVVAPATASSIARFAGGLADDLLGAVVLASRAPVLLAPAMNVNMWQNPLTQHNLGRLVSLGRFRTVGPDAGELACGWVGEGRLIEPAEIVAAAEATFAGGDLAGCRVVITAGPTFEPIDDVRFIGNRSSGKMGFALAAAAARRGASVTLIAGPVALPTPAGGGVARVDVGTAAQMRSALAAAVVNADVVVMAAAVADFRPAAPVAGKLSRRKVPGHGPGAGAVTGGAATAAAAGAGSPTISLVANPDLLAELAASRRGGRPLLVGFAAELAAGGAGALAADDLVARARHKLVEKRCDVIVGNDVGNASGGFGADDNAVTVVFADGRAEALPRAPKSQIAHGLWDLLAAELPGRAAGAPRKADRPRGRPVANRRRPPLTRPGGARAVGPRGRRG